MSAEETTFNKLAIITKSYLNDFFPKEKIINSETPLYPLFNLRAGKEIIDYQKSEAFLICAMTIFFSLKEKGIVDTPIENYNALGGAMSIDALKYNKTNTFVNVFTEHLSEFINKEDVDYALTLHFQDRIPFLVEEIKDVLQNSKYAEPINCIYCLYKGPLVGPFLLTSIGPRFKQNIPDEYSELKDLFISRLLEFQSRIDIL